MTELAEVRGILLKLNSYRKKVPDDQNNSFPGPFKASGANKRPDTGIKAKVIPAPTKKPFQLARVKAVEPFLSTAKPPSAEHLSRTSPEELVAYYQSQALAESTKKEYLRGWGRYTAWANSNSRSTKLPLSVDDIHQFLAHLATTSGSWSQVNLALQGIKYQYRLQKVNYHVATRLEKDLLEGIQRSLRKQVTRVHALTAEDAERMARRLLPLDWI